MKPTENEAWLTIGGWYDDEHCDLLYEIACSLPKNAVIVELGAFNGKSGTALALSGRQTYLIDNFVQDDCRQILVGNLSRLALRNCGLIEGLSWTIGQHWTSGEVSLLHVDAGHQEKEVEKDLRAWLPHMVRPGGIIMIHDFNDDRKPGVTIVAKRMLGKPTVVHKPAPFVPDKVYVRTWLAEYRL